MCLAKLCYWSPWNPAACTADCHRAGLASMQHSCARTQSSPQEHMFACWFYLTLGLGFAFSSDAHSPPKWTCTISIHSTHQRQSNGLCNVCTIKKSSHPYFFFAFRSWVVYTALNIHAHVPLPMHTRSAPTIPLVEYMNPPNLSSQPESAGICPEIH